MFNKYRNIFAAICLVLGIGLIGTYFYKEYEIRQVGKPVPQSQIKKTVYTTFKDYDFINLPFLKVKSIKTSRDDMKINFDNKGHKKLTFNLVDVYDNKVQKTFTSSESSLRIKYDDVSSYTSRYDLLTKVNGVTTKLLSGDLNNSKMSLQNNFGIINNGGLELCFNRIFVDFDNEFKIFFKDLNYYRKSIGVSAVKYDKKISDLALIRANDEVNDSAYNFHYSSSTGYSNIALINSGAVDSDCGKIKDLETNKFCNIKYKGKSFSVNVHGNDFEQITKGILFAHQNLIALKASQIHNADLISPNKSYIGGGFAGSKLTTMLQTSDIIMYGPLQDHTIDQANDAYIDGDFSKGIKKPSDQQKTKVKFLNTSFSIYMI